MADWTFGKKVGLGFALSALTLLVVAVVGYQSTYRLIENDQAVQHSHEVRRHLTDLLSELKDAETGQRGYLLTGDETYLEPHTTALGEIKKTEDDLRAALKANPEQLRQLDAILPLVENKLAELKLTINTRRSSGLEAALKIVVAGTGKNFMDQVRQLALEMDTQEEQDLERRRDTAEQSAQSTKSVILWGSLMGVALVVIIGWYLTDNLSKQIGSAAQQVQSSSAELQSVANQQVTGSREQSTAMNEISTTISELLATSRQISESAQRVSQIAEQTASSARSGDATVEKAGESMVAIRRQVDLMVTHMLELGKKSQQIGSVLDIVSELAEQTNILAINATIESAGAGEAGKRFAVVADEIPELADRVSGSSKEIRTLVDEVRSAVNTTVMATETGSKSVDAGSKQFSAVAGALKQIAGLVTTTTEAAREIELSTKQQASAVEQVNVAIANVAQASRETEASSGQTLQTASQLVGLSRELLRLIQPEATIGGPNHGVRTG